ncbi:MAG TPA: Fe-S-binding domain-containing protein, partial [Acidobacteriota bacterium]|nr:Fe-S-binding domain-containing protein [Acidobacteriota bacterium]
MLGNENILTTLLLIPTVGAILLALLPGRNHSLIRNATLAITALTFACSLPLAWRLDAQNGGMQFVQDLPWIQAGGFTISYHIGIDGI